MELILSEEDLIEYAKPYLKAKGFKKKNKRWTKDVGDFTLCFYIQGSAFSKERYYIRPGIFVNALMPTNLVYGHWMTEIKPTTPENILHQFEQWCSEWTDKALIKSRLADFIEWKKRNPLEKRREESFNSKSDPVPAYEFLMMDLQIKEYILNNF